MSSSDDGRKPTTTNSIFANARRTKKHVTPDGGAANATLSCQGCGAPRVEGNLTLVCTRCGGTLVPRSVKGST